MKRLTDTTVPALLLLVLLTGACGGEQSVASKSAAAYREAQAKGVTIGGGHEHGGHAVEMPASNTTTTDHAAHGASTEAHAGMDHGSAAAASDHAAHGATGAADHAAMGHGTSPSAHAGMAHGASGTATGGHAQHTTQATSGAQTDHSQHAGASSTARGPAPASTDPHAQHAAAPDATAATSLTAASAPRSTAEVRSMQPSSTLRGDAFDAPAPAAVMEAGKAAQGGGHEGHQMRGITPGEDDENPPTPMPATRDGAASGSPAANQTAALYTCPMHPEVTSGKPGTCPKCGMALVKRN